MAWYLVPIAKEEDIRQPLKKGERGRGFEVAVAESALRGTAARRR